MALVVGVVVLAVEAPGAGVVGAGEAVVDCGATACGVVVVGAAEVGAAGAGAAVDELVAGAAGESPVNRNRSMPSISPTAYLS